MLFLLYNLILIPVLFPVLVWRLLVRGKSRHGLSERFGGVPALGPAPPGGRVWVQAVSVGETVAAKPVVAALRQALPQAEVVLSTTTPAGQAQARRLLPEVDQLIYFPFDLPWVVRRVLLRLQPSVIVLVEAEIWPNLLLAARASRVPVVVANGHISDRTFRRASRLRGLLTPLVCSITRYLAQSEKIRDRAAALGMTSEQVVVTGHTKFDQETPQLSGDDAAEIRCALGLSPGQPLFLAGSTHEGEEEQVLDAWERARSEAPTLALMLAPRHLERVAAVQALIERRGLRVVRRSGVQAFGGSGAADGGREAPNARTPERLNAIYLLDTMGELARFYGLATAAFVGGSLVPKGGHDILQPLFHGVPTLFGPHMHNQRALAELALTAGAVRQVGNAGELGQAVAALVCDERERKELGEKAARLLAENRGASGRCAAAVAALLQPEGGNASPGGEKTKRDAGVVPA